jgi:squalene cyclase
VGFGFLIFGAVVAQVAGREFMRKHGGALTCPSWAKFWLCVLGVHEWEGINSIPAEMWLLPFWFPFHPGKLWSFGVGVGLVVDWVVV